MSRNMQTGSNVSNTQLVLSNKDLFGQSRGLGVSTITFKVTPTNRNDILILENTFTEKGGPARHLHHDQDEWFYAVEGNFIIEIGTKRFTVKPGDSILAPRRIPHVWAFLGESARGKMLITFMPAGKMEAFFRIVTKVNAMPPQDPELWKVHGMELIGPPLSLF